MKYTVVIIEDEEPAAKRMETLLKDIDSNLSILMILDSVESAIHWFQQNTSPDLLILDIQLADGISFEIFTHVKVESFVIFTTAYDEYAIKAFELNSIDYLLKPIEQMKLQKSLLKFHQLKEKTSPGKIQQLLQFIETREQSYKKRFIVQAGNMLRSIETSTIVCFFSVNKDTFLLTNEMRSYPIDLSLDKLETLIDPTQFFRINRQVIIHYHAIKQVVILSKSRIKLIPDFPFNDTLLVSTGKTKTFRKWLDQ